MARAAEPARNAGNSAVPAADEARSFAGNILLVEANRHFGVRLRRYFEERGCKVIEAADGQTGIDRFRTSASKMDVVLLDVTLPGISGREVLDELRRIQPNLKVILTSAYRWDWVQDSVGATLVLYP
jgi:DNA-binding response OmpR family regulator